MGDDGLAEFYSIRLGSPRRQRSSSKTPLAIRLLSFFFEAATRGVSVDSKSLTERMW